MMHFPSPPSRRGFTLIEILVVTILLGVFASIVVVSYAGSSRVTRDARRKKDLASVQAALEVYKLNTGSYPDHTNCGSTATWPGCATPWIAGMTDQYLSELPVDPKQNTTGYIANTDDETYTYNYVRVSPTAYYLITRLENESDTTINGDDHGFPGARLYVVSQPR